MNVFLHDQMNRIVEASIKAVQPDAAVKRTLEGRTFQGRVLLVAIGKASWQMAKAACDCLGPVIDRGVVITKYGHVKGELPRCTCYEAGHPVPDSNSFAASEEAIKLVRGLSEKDTVIFLVSGGGSALFEKPLVSGEELQDITSQLLACGADIVEINTIRKRLSAVKGGRFAALCRPAKVLSIVLSDILGDPLDMIASGPACPDKSTCSDAKSIAKKYSLKLSETALKALDEETPKVLCNVESYINGSVRELCKAAEKECRALGYETVMLTDMLSCQAKEAGSFMASLLKTHSLSGKSIAFIAGGETVVVLTGKGKGGRNQELALAATEGIKGIKGAAVFSCGSDGTDGPTDAAGGYADGDTFEELKALGLAPAQVLKENDAYNALKKTGGLIMTGPTGTNVNDFAVALFNAQNL